MASFTGVGDDDDAAFLSAIAEAEADGLRRLSQDGDSRRKHERQHAEPTESVSSSLPSSHHGGYSYRDKEAAPKRSRVEPEGEYMAALRGIHSETWQAMSSKARPDAKPAASSYSGSANQHRSKATMTPSPWGADGFNIPGQAEVPQRNCQCGGGTCLVLTANTEKNPGRQFYRCPLRKEEGQCGFFEWCDGITSSSQGLSKEQGSSYMHSEFPCPCGAGSCVILTAKTEKNMGRQFYRCPLNQGEGSCGFFKWCDESVPASGTTAPAYGGSAFGERTSQGLSKEQGSSSMDSEFPCPCGAGPCVILTAKTEKNMGRQFYRCPLNQGEGSCGFFKWCDESAPASGAIAPAYGGSAFGERTSQGLFKEQSSSAMHSEFPCPCGAGPCVILTAKTEKNMGRQFYRCPLNQGEGSCGFFKWLDENAPASGATASAYGGRAFGAPNQQFSHGNKGGVGGFNRQGGEDKFSRGFPNASGYGSPGTGRNTRQTSYGGHSQGAYGQASLSGRSGGSGSCYKCGGQGHRANECRADGKGRNMY